jgi:hypothetical protein
MKRLAPLALIVLALAAVPVALADDAPPPAPPAAAAAHDGGHLRLQILRLQLRLVGLRYRVACKDDSSDRCTEFTQKVTDRLTKLDDNVQAKLTELKCTPDSTERKCAVLTKLDSRLQDMLAKLSA